MKLLLANDTGTARHIGCQGVSDAHARMLGAAGHEVVHRLFLGEIDHHKTALDADLLDNLARDETVAGKMDTVDAVVVNGEGTIHHGAGRPLLALLALAQKKRKPAFLVNAVFQESESFLDTLGALDDFTVRDGRSLAYAKSLGLGARWVPDSFLAAKSDDAEPDLKGDVVTDGHHRREDVVAALEAYRTASEATLLPLLAKDAYTSWSRMKARLREADVLVTGRHHGIYLALKAGIPFVALGSNTFKVEGLLEDIGRPDLMASTLHDIWAVRERVIADRGIFKNLAERLTGGAPLSTFAALGTGGPDRTEAELARLVEQRDACLARKRATRA